MTATTATPNKVQNLVYLLVPNEANERILHAGRTVSGATGCNDEMAVEFEKAICPAPGADANLYFELNGKFMQQGATVLAIKEADPIPLEPLSANQMPPFVPAQLAVFKRVGQPVSAEARGSYRVSVAAQNMFGQVENEKRCPLVDISPEGFGIILTRPCSIGTMVQVQIENEGECMEGPARVQTVRQLGRNRFRCGFLVASTEKKMRGSLQRITAAAQRAQLQRLKRSA